jgi:hypothetical protein
MAGLGLPWLHAAQCREVRGEQHKIDHRAIRSTQVRRNRPPSPATAPVRATARPASLRREYSLRCSWCGAQPSCDQLLRSSHSHGDRHGRSSALLQRPRSVASGGWCHARLCRWPGMRVCSATQDLQLPQERSRSPCGGDELNEFFRPAQRAVDPGLVSLHDRPRDEFVRSADYQVANSRSGRRPVDPRYPFSSVVVFDFNPMTSPHREDPPPVLPATAPTWSPTTVCADHHQRADLTYGRTSRSAGDKAVQNGCSVAPSPWGEGPALSSQPYSQRWLSWIRWSRWLPDDP